MKDIAKKFEAEVAKAVSQIRAASHALAAEALDEAFGMRGTGSEHKGAEGRARPAATPRQAPSTRRSGEEIAVLEKRFLDAVWKTPGESMSVLAPRVDTSPSALQVPVARLRAAGRIKTVGARQFTRYFPIERSECDDVGDGAAA
jgi:hypothetical protein